MIENIEFKPVDHPTEINHLKSKVKELLVYPNDDYFDYIINNSDPFLIKMDGNDLGFFSLNKRNEIQQFYLEPKWMYLGFSLLLKVIRAFDVPKIQVGTNYPYFYSLVMRLQQEFEIVFLLFKNQLDIQQEEMDGVIKLAKRSELNEIVEFNQLMNSSSKDWLTNYFSKWIKNDSVFTYRIDGKIQGVFEVRYDKSSPKTADLGMFVAEECRNKGLGTYLLGKAKAKALELGLTPICMCKESNIGSLKCIQRNGFVVEHLIISASVKP